ncbi:endonuclease/exonuclease/phosphatase family protein [Bacteriovoracaceae bacterium]|nr:endonuclease/exonuclease/phosphatase family protein [Bacteriovoracaceae bacterium]
MKWILSNLLFISFICLRSASADIVSLKVGTFNIWDKPVFKSKHANWRVKKFCQLILDDMQDLDILGIQELWRRRSLKRVVKCLRKSKFKIYYSRDSRGFKRAFWKRNGLLILSRYPLKKIRQISFRPHEKSYRRRKGIKFRKQISEKFINKGFMHLQLEVIQGEKSHLFHIYNTHLAANFGPKNRQHPLRKFQLNLIINYIKKHSKGIPTVFLGDFNYALNGLKEKISDPLPGSSLHPVIYQELGFKEAVNYPASDTRSLHTYSRDNYYNSKSEGQLDHIYCGAYQAPSIKVNVEDSKLIFNQRMKYKKKKINLSDHYGFRSVCRFHLK